MIIIGIVLLPAPGPGWLIIFLGLGIWATEFAWAKSLLKLVRRTVASWTAWLRRQPRWLGVLLGAVGLIALGAVAAGAWLLVGNHLLPCLRCASANPRPSNAAGIEPHGTVA